MSASSQQMRAARIWRTTVGDMHKHKCTRVVVTTKHIHCTLMEVAKREVGWGSLATHRQNYY